MDGLRKFIEVDNHAAVKIGDLEKDTKSKRVVKPKFTADSPRAVTGKARMTLRAHEEGVSRTFIDTSNVGDQRWEPPLVDEDCHAIRQAIYKGERSKVRNPRKIKSKVLLALKEANHKGFDCHDAGHALGNPFEEPDGSIGQGLGRS